MKRIVIIAVAAVLGAGVLPLGTAASRADEAVFSSYGADASATSVHVLSYTNALTNFATGFLDNSYPLASTHLDAGPASQAVASILDTGPLGVTGEGQVKPNLDMISPGSGDLVTQPQYAVARYPGPSSASLSDGGSVAEARADAISAQASAALVAGSADDATSNVKVDQVTGVVTGESRGHVNRAVFGNGLLNISDVDVLARVTIEDSKVTPHYEISVGGATVNNTPVKITDKGVVVADEPLPGSDVMTQVVNEQLNGALASSGFEVFVTPPVVTTDTGQATVEVTGVHVKYTAPNPDPSVPTLSVDYILGEARAFSFGVPADVSGEDLVPSLDTVLPDLTSVEGATDFGDVSGAVSELTPQSGAASLQPPSRRLTTAPVSVRRPRPTWLVVIYLVWQVLVLMTGGALLWSRKDPVG
jgi:hypothetical protein